MSILKVATLLSLEGQADALGQIAGGLVVGAIGSAISLSAALVVAGMALLPALGFFARAVCQPAQPTLGISEPALVAAGEENR